MLGEITAKMEVEKILKKYPCIQELYSSDPDALISTSPMFTILYKHDLQSPQLLDDFLKLYPNLSSIYVTTNAQSILLTDKYLLWRNDKWYR